MNDNSNNAFGKGTSSSTVTKVVLSMMGVHHYAHIRPKAPTHKFRTCCALPHLDRVTHEWRARRHGPL